ncbi:mitochondrial fission regulator 2-like [Thrips palmi]|uniref:Mitochondrial fission regulator 2-like n=1 Tax=Thrips palmi TaxID=161013 RepID=A0A6P8ZHQ8_THRPL|nr:mitochondrial fission regulator 2-like [Thrips palmi]
MYFNIMGDQTSRRCGRYRSVVRMLSVLLPLRPAPRIFFNIVKNPSNVYDVKGASNAKEKVPETTAQTLIFRKCEFSPSQMSVKPDLLEFGSVSESIDDKNSSNEENKEDGVVTQKIDNLERELQELREQMSRIMAAQCQIDKTREAPRIPQPPPMASSTPSAPAPPPPPPPPPPPLPPMMSLSTPKLVITKSQTANANTPKRPGMKMPFDMADVLKDMGKVKLRRIERSPGGTPLRQAPPATDPNTVLMNVLKKRYAAMHDKTPEKIHRCLESDSSFGEDNFSPQIIC